MKKLPAALALVTLAVSTLAASGCSVIKYESEQTAGSEVYFEERLRSRIDMPLQDVQEATVEAYRHFGVGITKTASDQLSGVVQGILANGKGADTELSSISPMQTEVSIKVGDGDIYISRRILEEIKRSLKRPSPEPPS